MNKLIKLDIDMLNANRDDIREEIEIVFDIQVEDTTDTVNPNGSALLTGTRENIILFLQSDWYGNMSMDCILDCFKELR